MRSLLRYAGLDGIDRTTTLHFAPAPAQLDPAGAEFVLDLGPGARLRLALRAGCGDRGSEDWTVGRFYRALRARAACAPSIERARRRVEGSNAVFNELARRSVADLYMLITDTPHGPYPFAGMPWFSTVFGRDGIITALQTLWLDPRSRAACWAFSRRRRRRETDRRARRRAGQDPARDAQGRDGAARRGAVRPLLRQRRRDAAVRDAGRRVFRAHRRPRH